MTCKLMCQHFASLMRYAPQQAFWSWLSEQGKETPDPAKEREKWQPPLAGFTPKARCCFYNAQALALFHGAEYWEGYAMTELGIPIEHAWNVKNGRIIDLTWKDAATEYFGVKVPTDYIRKRWLADKISSSLASRYFIEELYKKGLYKGAESSQATSSNQK